MVDSSIHASSNLHHDVSTETVRSCSTSEIVSNCKLLAHFRKPGWALPKRKHTKFSYKQRKFAYDEFMAGELSGRNTSPEKVIGNMRSARDEDGNKLFIPTEYFTREQVISLFSSMASKKRSGELSEPIQLQERIIWSLWKNKMLMMKVILNCVKTKMKRWCKSC